MASRGAAAAPGTPDPRNRLNDLDGTAWIRFTRSWFVEDGVRSEITRAIDLHPASFPPSLAEEFILFFTKRGGRVLDPFAGTGSTLVAAEAHGREALGIELMEKYHATAASRVRDPRSVLLGDARGHLAALAAQGGAAFDLTLTSPPYWNILHKEKDYVAQERRAKGLDLRYGNAAEDFGNVEDYGTYLAALAALFSGVHSLTRKGGHLVVIAQNVRDGGEVVPIAFDLTQRLMESRGPDGARLWEFHGERIWAQSQKSLKPYGYPFAFVSNVHHHYCLIFRKA